ncbi:MAG: cohesin domain-containing protein [Bellilinea sp.]
MFKRLFIHLILAAGLLLISPLAGARAQSGTTLLLLPEDSALFLNSTKSINLAVLGGVDVNAFDVTILYDPQVLALESWVYGSYLSSLWRVYLENEPGEFHLAVTQLAQPGVSGDGVLLTFVFKGLGEGVSALEITNAEFSSPTGFSTKPLTEDALLTVNGPTKTPTETAVPSLTPTASSTLTRTPSPTATRTAYGAFTATRTLTRTPSPTATRTAYGAFTATRTLTRTPSPTATRTAYGAFTATRTLTRTPSPTAGATRMNTSPPNAGATGTPLPTSTPAVSKADAAAPPGPTGLPVETLPPKLISANPAGAVQPAETAPERLTADSASSAEKDLLFGLIAFETLDRILAAALILFIVVFTFLITLLTRRSSTRNP